jgi:hypothetical protein
MQSPETSENEIKDILDECYADIVREFGQPINKPQGLESLVKEVYYRHISRWRRAWVSPKKCIYPDCEQTTGISSHTIQKAGALRLISENGHALSPRLNKSNGVLTLESIGLNQASTFTGFCETHERIFKYERNKIMVTDDDYESQVFRTVCRELRTLRQHVLSIKDALALYKKIATTEMISRAMERLGAVFFKKKGIHRVSFQFDIKNQITALFRSTIEECQCIYDRIFRIFYQAFREDENHRLTAPALQSFEFTLPLEIPVALAGRTGITVLENNTAIAIDLILNVNPYSDKTVCFITCTEENGSLVERFLGMYQNDIERLSLVESWMLYGSDHWFIKPSTWLCLPARRRELLCEIIGNSDDHIGTKCELSIFDAARIQLIEKLKTVQLETPDNAFIQSLLANECSKLK